MILAAGRGQRMRPITDAKPKCLVEVQGESLIRRHVRRLRDAGFNDLVINIAWLGDQIQRHLGDGSRLGVCIQYSDEGDTALETGGGIHRVLPWFEGESFLVVNADLWTDFDFATVAKATDDLAHLVLVPVPPEKSKGDFHLAAGRVSNEPRTVTFSGISMYQPELFAGCQPGVFSVVPLIRSAADMGRLGGELYSGIWHDVGTVERLQALHTE